MSAGWLALTSHLGAAGAAVDGGGVFLLWFQPSPPPNQLSPSTLELERGGGGGVVGRGYPNFLVIAAAGDVGAGDDVVVVVNCCCGCGCKSVKFVTSEPNFNHTVKERRTNMAVLLGTQINLFTAVLAAPSLEDRPTEGQGQI